MDYDQFYTQMKSLLRLYSNLPGNSQVQICKRTGMKTQALSDIINRSTGINSRTEFDLYCDMGVDPEEFLKIIEAGIEKRRVEFAIEELKKKKVKKEKKKRKLKTRLLKDNLEGF